jgi:hypothetical protein
MARRAHAYSRRKKTALYVAGGGIALGLGAVFLWPILKRRYQQPSITVPESEIIVSSSGSTNSAAEPFIDSWRTGDPINESALTWLTPEQRASLEWDS